MITVIQILSIVNILPEHPDITIYLSVWIFFSIAIISALWRAPWYHLKDPSSLNIYLATTVGVMIIWTLKAGLGTGLSIHLLGATLLTLMFGWAFAILSIVIVITGHTISAGTGWNSIAANTLVLGVIPVAISYGFYRLAENRLPNHFFIYIFVIAFFGAGLAAACSAAATSLVYVLGGPYSTSDIWDNYTRFALLMVFPEAFVTGMLMTIFVVYRPQWVSTFDDNRYLKGK